MKLLTNYRSLVLVHFLVYCVISILIATPSYSGEKLNLSEEIEKVECQLKNMNLKPKLREALVRYSEVLLFIQLGEPGIGLQKYPGKLSQKKINRVKSAAFSLPYWAQAEVSPQEIYNLLNYIEKNKVELKAAGTKPNSSRSIYRLPLLNRTGFKEVAILSSDSSSPGLFLDFKKKFEQVGSGKSFKKAVSYKTFSPVAELVSHQNCRSMECLEKEVQLLKQLRSLHVDGRSAVADLLGYLPGRFFQTLADMDLEQFYSNNIGDEVQKLEVVFQLITQGLVPLHKLGISHNDIKFENILIRDVKKNDPDHPQRFEAVYNDFGLATIPQMEIEKKNARFQGGTSYTLAPEALEDWVGTDAEKLENYFKADVFSQAIVTLILLRPEDSKQVFNCDNGGGKLSDKIFCRKQALIDLYEKFLQKPNYQALDHLLMRALSENPADRISDEQFAYGITHIHTKLPKLGFVHGYKLDELNARLSEFPNFVPLHVSNEWEVLVHEKGQYFLTPKQIGSNYFVQIQFVDSNLKVRKQVLDIDPFDLIDLEKEIRFLTEIGTLSRSSA